MNIGSLRKTKIFLSPTGKYGLTIEYYEKNKKKGIVNRISDNKEIIVILRDTYDFPFTFFNKNDKEWLWCGKDRLEQTFINLDDENIYTKKTSDFWTNMNVSPLGDILVVNGCVCCGPPEYSFSNFINPEEDITYMKEIFTCDNKDYISASQKAWKDRTPEERYIYNYYTYVIFPDDSKLKWIDNYTLDITMFEKVLKEGYTYHDKYPRETEENCYQIIARNYIIHFDLAAQDAIIEDITIRPYKIIDWINEEDEDDDD